MVGHQQEVLSLCFLINVWISNGFIHIDLVLWQVILNKNCGNGIRWISINFTYLVDSKGPIEFVDAL